MKPLIKAALVAALLVATPVWAHNGPDRGWSDHRHSHRHWDRGHHHRPYWHHRDTRSVRRVEHVYRVEPYPVESASAAPGIHLVFPDVFLPWPR